MGKYCEKDIITCYRSDSHHKMRSEAFLDFAQQLAVKGAQLLSFNDTALSQLGCIWVLARMHVRFERDVAFDEKVDLSTWHKGQSGLYFLRDYQLCDRHGAVVNATSSWIVMNAETRHISRDEKVLELLSVGPQSEDHAIKEASPKITVPKDCTLEVIGEHTVRYSDVDYNNHANNVKYTVWALDHLPDNIAMTRRLKELSINFNKETLLGETVTLYHCITPEGEHIVEGRSGDIQVFIEKLLFE